MHTVIMVHTSSKQSYKGCNVVMVANVLTQIGKGRKQRTIDILRSSVLDKRHLSGVQEGKKLVRLIAARLWLYGFSHVVP